MRNMWTAGNSWPIDGISTYKICDIFHRGIFLFIIYSIGCFSTAWVFCLPATYAVHQSLDNPLPSGDGGWILLTHSLQWGDKEWVRGERDNSGDASHRSTLIPQPDSVYIYWQHLEREWTGISSRVTMSSQKLVFLDKTLFESFWEHRLSQGAQTKYFLRDEADRERER